MMMPWIIAVVAGLSLLPALYAVTLAMLLATPVFYAIYRKIFLQ
jgi:hypothetical protein